MAKLPTSKMSLAQFNATTLRNQQNRMLKFRVRVNLTVNKVVQNTRLTVAQRVKIAGQVLRDAVVINLSRPVRKFRGPKSKRIQVDPKSRSKPGEFPRADTTMLMKSIYHKHIPEQVVSRIGTPLGYGVVLEARMNRSFLRRTLREMRRDILLIVRRGQIS
jgi:hypothetical protein